MSLTMAACHAVMQLANFADMLLLQNCNDLAFLDSGKT